jgi:hypothetical protein
VNVANMITDSSKDYATGEILVHFDAMPTVEEVIAYVEANYGVTSMDIGPMSPPEQFRGLDNPGSCRVKIHNLAPL